jgi:hypothetical protein
MKRAIICLTLFLLWLAGPVNASTWTIMDKYIGGIHTGSWAQNNGDVISLDSEIDYFDIDLMDVTIETNGDVNVTIQTGYDPDNTSATYSDSITYGDLFVSTNGWTPYDPESLGDYNSDIPGSGYVTDSYLTEGESWEFVLNTVSQNIYAVDEDNIRLSNHVMKFDESWYRQNQEVLYEPGDNEDPLSSFVFSHTGRFINYAFNLEDFGLPWEDALDLGFHWTMTCANDVIEGGIYKAPVPEPGTMLLLGLGMIGLGAVGRKRYTRE